MTTLGYVFFFVVLLIGVGWFNIQIYRHGFADGMEKAWKRWAAMDEELDHEWQLRKARKVWNEHRRRAS